MNNPSRSNWISSKRPFLRLVDQGIPAMQSFVVKDGRTVRSPVQAVMTSEQWLAADQTVNRVFRENTPLLQAILARRELVIGDLEVVGKLTLEYQEMSDPGEAVPYAEDLPKGVNPSLFITRAIPLPFTSVNVTWLDDDHAFLDLLAKRVKTLAASVESQIRQALPINAQTLQIELTPATFRLVMGMPPQLLQRDGRMPEFVVTCIIVPDDRTKPTPTTLSEATRSFDLAPQRRINEVVEDVSIGAIFAGRKPDA